MQSELKKCLTPAQYDRLAASVLSAAALLLTDSPPENSLKNVSWHKLTPGDLTVEFTAVLLDGREAVLTVRVPEPLQPELSPPTPKRDTPPPARNPGPPVVPEPSQPGITQEYTETIHVRRFYLDSVAIDALLSRALKAGLCSLPGGPVEDLEDVDVTVSTDGERVSAIVKVTGKTRSS